MEASRLQYFGSIALIICAIIGGERAMAQNAMPVFYVCHGYDCHFNTKVSLAQKDIQMLHRLFLHVADSRHEREAIRKAVAIFENRATEVIGIRDEPKMAFGRPLRKGQMDCVDESINTERFLRFLENKKLIHFYKVEKRTSRGIFIDGRYPHWTAVITDNDNKKWAVDSWYEAGGGMPDIMPLSDWKKRGIGGKR